MRNYFLKVKVEFIKKEIKSLQTKNGYDKLKDYLNRRGVAQPG
jgi:hypothetical protein